MEEIDNGWKTDKKEDEFNEESIYFKEMRRQLLENDQLSYEEEGFMLGYEDIEEFEKMEESLKNSEDNLEGEI